MCFYQPWKQEKRLIKKGMTNMKLLKIKEQKGFFINPSNIDKEKSIDDQYKNIEIISKEDILSMIDFIMENDIEMDDAYSIVHYSKNVTNDEKK